MAIIGFMVLLVASAFGDETCLLQTSHDVIPHQGRHDGSNGKNPYHKDPSKPEHLASHSSKGSSKHMYLIDDEPGLGMRWEGVGAISGGGATSKLLPEYPEKQRSEVLDYLFKPNYGLNLQILKVELGGDTDSTEGSEPSHMHSKGDENYERGYEWWLMKEAKARNPDIKLYALPWGWPGWLDPKASFKKKAHNVFADPKVIANYTLAWILGAKREHGLTIDYVGQWNERNAPGDYADALRQAVKESEVAKQTTVLNRLVHYPGSHDTPNDNKCKDYKWNTTDGSRWVDEEGSTFDGRSARCLARVMNRNYISHCHTATFQWHLISSFYDYLPWARNGVAVANQPWSGSYEITSPTWSLAHTTQFAPIGWRYAGHGNGVDMLSNGGSMVTRVSPDLKDFSIVLEKMSAQKSDCARGWNPQNDVPTTEVIMLKLKGAFLSAARRAGGLNVWYSNLDSGTEVGDNAPDNQLFQKRAKLQPDHDGVIQVTVHAEEMFTLTTLETGGKGDAKSPAATPFPVPFSQNYDNEKITAPAKLWFDQMGAFEVQKSPYGDSATRGNVMRQVVPVWPECWGYSCTGPSSYFGPSSMQGDLVINFDVRMEDEAAFKMDFLDIMPSNVQYHSLNLDTAGSFSLGPHKGAVDFSANKWHSISIRNHPEFQTLRVDGCLVANFSVSAPPVGLALCDKKEFKQGQSLSAKEENEVMGVLGLSPGPTSAIDASTCRQSCCDAGTDCYMYLWSTSVWQKPDRCLFGKSLAGQGYHMKVLLSKYIHASIDNFAIKAGADECPEGGCKPADLKECAVEIKSTKKIEKSIAKFEKKAAKKHALEKDAEKMLKKSRKDAMGEEKSMATQTRTFTAVSLTLLSSLLWLM